MARVTVEDCIDKIPNRFELVLFSAHRARIMATGNEPLLPRDKDKDTVLALREIAESVIVPDEVREDVISTLQTKVAIEEDEAEMSRVPEGPEPLPEEGMMDEEKIRAALESLGDVTSDEPLRG